MTGSLCELWFANQTFVDCEKCSRVLMLVMAEFCMFVAVLLPSGNYDAHFDTVAAH